MSRLAYSTLIAVTVLSFTALIGPARATVLTFEMTGPAPATSVGGFEGVYGGYGDNVSSTSSAGFGTTYNYGVGNGFTPNITVAYTHVDNAPAGSLGHSVYAIPAGGWSDQVDYLHYQPEDRFWVTFTPSSGYGVTVNSFHRDFPFGLSLEPLQTRNLGHCNKRFLCRK